MIRISVISKEEDLNRIFALLSTQEDFIITDTGHNGYDAIKSAGDLHPDILIMNLWMDDINGTDIAPIIKRKSPETKLIVVSSSSDAVWIKPALRAGISGFLFGQFDTETLANAVRTVRYGGYYLSKPEKNYVSHLFGIDLITESASEIRAAENAIPPDISDTEQKILIRMTKGYSDKEIADDLCIATGTVRNYLAAIKRRTGQKTRVQLAIYSIMHGLTGIPPENEK